MRPVCLPALLLIVLTTLSIGCGDAGGGGGGDRLVLLTNGASPFWEACRAGMDDAAKEFGVNAVMEVNNGTPEGQLEKLRQLGNSSDVKAVAVSAIDGKNVAIADELKKLRKKGVHVITIDSDFDASLHDAREAYLGTDNVAAGRVLGKSMAGMLPDGGEYVTFVGLAGAQNAKERHQGIEEGAGEKFKRLDLMADDTDSSKARENVRNAILNHPDADALVGIWSYNAPAIVDILKQQGNRDKFKVVVFDAEPMAIKSMQEGMIDAMVVQNPYQMGYQGVRLMKALVEKDDATQKEMFPKWGEDGGDIYDTGLKLVVPDEGSPVTADTIGDGAQFLKLAEFRKWLDKYDLKGS